MTTSERCVFEVPIYWCDERYFDSRYDRALKQFSVRYIKRTLSETFRRILERDFDQRYVAPWRYNQTVGWLRLSVHDSRIRADEWSINARRFGRNLRKKQFTLVGKAFEINCPSDQPSGEIFASILEELEAFQSESRRGIRLDLECLTSLGRFVDWRRLVDEAAI